MATFAPEQPTTEQLEAANILTSEATIDISLSRERISGILDQREPGLVAYVGPCALDVAALPVLEAEGQAMRDLTAESDNKGLYIVQRKPIWKPRSDAKSWWGAETTEPEIAYQALVDHANQGIPAAIEIGHKPHAVRYGKLLSQAWFGGRNIDNLELMQTVAVTHPDLPLAVKNGLDGSIDVALEHVAALQDLRDEDSGSVTLLYRGGKNAPDPQSWEYQYRTALERTQGQLIVDIAHGSEMAHDLKGNFEKSEIGQLKAMFHVLDIAEKGEIPVGIMMEASDAPSRVDPVIPIKLALDGVMHLYGLRSKMPTSIR